ncbi:MAG: TPM domain-containing protein [Ideonella sp.]|nr:TPM domain-containing protein [Ideonella sp.]MCC7458386.1 TPM domain-containing protein [Nitrospira sp.]
MNRVLRVLRHRVFDERDTRRAIGPAVMERLQQRVAASECRHSGEIRVCVEAGLPLSYLWRGLSARQRAITLFGKLRVWDTAHNNGVLIYLLLAEHAIEIVADRGLNAVVDRTHWASIVAGMREAFRSRRYEEGLNAAIDAVDALLVQHFALQPGAVNPNELPDQPILR